MITAAAPYVMPSVLRAYLDRRRRLVDRSLGQCLPRAGAYPPVIHQAMRYSVLAGGKRLRGILCLAACDAVGGRLREVLSTACALECIHAYSLIHDDLPAMDDAATRRGKPACHRRYGEGVAILAGDALLALGFEWLARGNHAPRRLQALKAVAQVTGTSGLVGGQVMDLVWQQGQGSGVRGQGLRATSDERRATNRARKLMTYINANKTAKLMSISTKVGALLGGVNAGQVRALERYGFHLGLTFQLTDDLLDHEGMAAVLGDADTRHLARRTAQRATQQLHGFGRTAEPLRQLAEFIVWRTT